jgi:hypothetical protein
MTERIVATFNVGSSSIKLAAYAAAQSGGLGPRLLRAEIAGLPDAPRFSAVAASSEIASAFLSCADISDLRLAALTPRLIIAMGPPSASLSQPLDTGLSRAAGTITRAGPRRLNSLQNSIRCAPWRLITNRTILLPYAP